MEKEVLDFCRVKKIFEKGFGFLTSLYYNEPVFFHFNRVKDEATKEKLEKMKRGEVYFFYTSIMKNDKRRVYKLWLDISKIDKHLIPGFIERLIKELNGGKINVFELSHVIYLLRDAKQISKDKLKEILISQKFLRTPSALKAILSEDELAKFDNLEKLFDDLQSNNINKEQWVQHILDNIM